MAATHMRYDNPIHFYALEERPGRWKVGVEPFAVFGSGSTEEEALEKALQVLRSRLNEIAPTILRHESPQWEGNDFEQLERLKAQADHVWLTRVVVEAAEPNQQTLRIIVHEGELRRMDSQ